MEDNNLVKIVKDQNGNDIRVEMIETFSVQEIGKSYMAFTLNDDGASDKVKISFVEILNPDSDKPTIKPVDDNEVDLVIDAFNALVEAAQEY